MQTRQISRQDHAHLVGEDLVARAVHHAAAVAVAVEAERQIRAALAHGVGHVVQHLQRLGVGIVMRERVVERRVPLDHLDPDPAQQFRREGACRPVPVAQTTRSGRVMRKSPARSSR